DLAYVVLTQGPFCPLAMMRLYLGAAAFRYGRAQWLQPICPPVASATPTIGEWLQTLPRYDADYLQQQAMAAGVQAGRPAHLTEMGWAEQLQLAFVMRGVDREAERAHAWAQRAAVRAAGLRAPKGAAYAWAACAHKGQVEKKVNTLEQNTTMSTVKLGKDKQVGLKKSTFIASVFHGSQTLFDQAKAEGEAWEENGFWYHDKKERSNSQIIAKDKIATQRDVIVHDETPMAIMAEMHEEADTAARWKALGDKIESGSAPSRFQSEGKKATEADMKVGTSLVQKAGNEAVCDVARQGIEKLKSLVKPTQAAEIFLTRPAENVMAKGVATAIEETATQYRECLDYYRELERMYESHVGKIEERQ
ncbi:unnamed protein product, partial [Prorocentrum cordatum]